MDAEAQQKIISGHRHLVSSKPPTQVRVKGKHSVEDSGPPSPTYGPVKNFGEVVPGIYRSSFPYPGNIEHLRSLKLRSILTLVDTTPCPDYVEFIREREVQHFRIKVPAHKDPSIVIPIDVIIDILKIMLDPENHPILIHCNKGKHRTGCMVACYRKLHDWSMPSVITEYRNYAGEKFRPLDEVFMNSFNAKMAREIIYGAGTTYVPIKVQLPTPPASETSDGNTDEDRWTLPRELSLK